MNQFTYHLSSKCMFLLWEEAIESVQTLHRTAPGTHVQPNNTIKICILCQMFKTNIKMGIYKESQKVHCGNALLSWLLAFLRP